MTRSEAALRIMFKAVVAVVLAAIIIVLMLYLRGTFTHKVGRGGEENMLAPAAGGTVDARLITLPSFEQAPGTVQPLHETSVASKVREGEKIVEMNVTAGQEVHKGQVLVKLDPTTWRNRKEMAEAKLHSATATRDDAKNLYDRLKEAAKVGAATSSEVDNAKYRYDTAAADVDAARRAVDEAALNLSYTEIVAPSDAVVIDKRADVGDTVQPGQVLVSLYDKMQLVADVREGLLKHLTAGQEVGVRLENMNESCTGTVSEIVPQANPATRTFQVKVTGPCRRGVRPGMYGRLLVPLGDRRLLVIRPQTVLRVGQLTMVDVAAGGTVERRNIQLGEPVEFEGRRYVEVLSGLKAGEKVLLQTQTEPADGQ